VKSGSNTEYESDLPAKNTMVTFSLHPSHRARPSALCVEV